MHTYTSHLYIYMDTHVSIIYAHTYKGLHENICSTFTNSHHNRKQSTFLWIAEQTLMYQHNCILPRNKKGTTYLCTQRWMSILNSSGDVKGCTSVWKATYCMIPILEHSRKDKSIDVVKFSDLQVLWRGD